MRADLDQKSRMTVDELRKYQQKKNRGKVAPSEHFLQVQCVRWFRLKYKKALIYAIPNGVFTTKTSAGKLVSEGVKHGIPDLHIPIAMNGYSSLYIEMKNGKAGKISNYQKEMSTQLASYGNKVAICRSLEEFIYEVESYLGDQYTK